MGETAMLSSAVGDNVVFLDQSLSPHPIRYMVEIGDVRPLHATAAGRIFLAFGNRSVRSLGTLVAVTGDTTTDPGALSTELDRVRQMGYATNRGEGVTGVYGIAGPIFNGQAAPVAALGVAGPAERMDDMESRVWPALKAAIAEIETSHRVEDMRGGEHGTKRYSKSRCDLVSADR
jgi:DNA-binding IclR family transcriptional regulator